MVVITSSIEAVPNLARLAGKAEHINNWNWVKSRGCSRHCGGVEKLDLAYPMVAPKKRKELQPYAQPLARETGADHAPVAAARSRLGRHGESGRKLASLSLGSDQLPHRYGGIGHSA